SDGSITGARLLLFCALGAAAVFGVGIPFWRLSRARAVDKAEQTFPQFRQRLVTFVEKEDAHDPFLELLAADALDIAITTEPKAVVPGGKLLALLGVASISLIVLVWLIKAQPGSFGQGANLLWTGARETSVALSLQVTPGNATIRRNTDQLIVAQPAGGLSPRVVLYARYQSGTKWEQVAMRPRPGASGYQFIFTGL